MTSPTSPTRIPADGLDGPARYAVTLPIGLDVEGAWTREVLLEPITGRALDEVRGEGPGRTPAERFSGMLGHTTARLGPFERPGPEVLRRLCAGDRDALALHLHMLMFGDGIEATLSCPGCGELMDVELSASALLLPPFGRPGVEESVRIGHRDVMIRRPTGGDLEAVAGIAARDPDAAVASLLEACVRHIDGEPVPLAPDERDAVADALARLDPQADLQIELTCPACHRDASVPFDPSGFLLQELDRLARDLYIEVHALALHYHWSERDILGMPDRKRRLYIDLLEQSLEPNGALA